MSFLYFIQCGGEDGPIKIGTAYDISRRLENLQVGCPFELRLIAKFWAGDLAQSIERGLHDDCHPYLLRGEWFTAAILPIVHRVVAAAPKVNAEHYVMSARAKRPYPKRQRGLKAGEWVWRGKVRRSAIPR